MSVDHLKRVMWRLEGLNKGKVSKLELQRAIMRECGTSPKTYYNNKQALIVLGWIKTEKRGFRITKTHQTED